MEEHMKKQMKKPNNYIYIYMISPVVNCHRTYEETDFEDEKPQHIEVMFLPLIFLDKMKVVPSNNNGPYHLGTVASASNDTPSDRNITGERALLVYICPCKKGMHPPTSFFKCNFE